MSFVDAAIVNLARNQTEGLVATFDRELTRVGQLQLSLADIGHDGATAVSRRFLVHTTSHVPVNAVVEISPRVADPRLYPQLLRVAVELPGDLDVADIDCTTLALIDIDGNRLDCPIGCAAACEISDVNGNGRDDLSMWLPCDTMTRAAVAGGAVPGDRVTLKVRGELDDGRFFAATDTVSLAVNPAAIATVD